MSPTTTYRCGCGAVLGDRCAFESSDIDDFVVVEHMPEWRRGSHEAAGNRGVWPQNGAERFLCGAGCVEFVTDDDWTTEVVSTRRDRIGMAP